MKLFHLLFLLFSVSLADEPQLDAIDVKVRFEKWMHEFGKKYETVKEFTERWQIWIKNHYFIESHNKRHPRASYTLGHNQFSDLTFEEYKQLNKLGKYSPGVINGGMREEEAADTEVQRLRRRLADDDADDELPEEVNWVKKGALVPVKNQGMCGSCWAFSAIGAIEAAHFIDTGDLVALSEQQLIDCDPLDFGCMGGLMDNAFLFDEDGTGICSDEDYPYAGRKHWVRGCASAKGLCTGVAHTRVSSFIDVANNVESLMKALVKQPVSVAIEASHQNFQFYKSGVFSDDTCGSDLDHGVLAVGYGTEDGLDYFLVRNSWGESWGDEGYIKMARESTFVNGTCGILSWASRPLLRENY